MPAIDKVAISGAGVGGLTLALALKRAGIAVEVHEKYRHEQEVNTGFTIWSYAIEHLRDLGLPDRTLDRIGSRLVATELRNHAGKLLYEMPVGEVSQQLGAPSYDMRRADLVHALREAVGEDAVHLGSEVVDVEHDGGSATLILAGGGLVAGDVAVGADGIHSALREKIAGPATLRFSGDSGIGAAIEFSHELLKPGRHVELWGRGAKAGVADVGDGQARWYLVRAGQEPGARTTRREALELVGDGWYSLLRDIVEATTDEQVVATEAWDLNPIPTWVAGNAVLIGDAAHATTPFAAMGACMAIRDAAVLAELLTGGDGSVPDTLSAFEQRRKDVDEATVKHARRMAGYWEHHSPLAAWVRDQAFSHIPPRKMEEVANEMASGG